jgi:putative spermidine/putrescine transport system permease protein
VFLAVFFAYPVLTIATRSFTDVLPGASAFANYRWFFATDVNLTILRRTFVTAAAVTGVCLLVGYPYAYLLTIMRPRWRMIAIAVVLIPFWTSLMVRNFAWVVILQGNHGVLNEILGGLGLGHASLLGTVWAVIIGMSQILLPFLILPLYATLRSIDRRLLLAAEGMGARPWTAFVRVYFPLSLPGVAAGCLLVFVLSLGFYITPAMLGSPQQALISQLIVTQVSRLLDWGRGGAMAVVLLACTLLLLAVGALLLRRTGSGRGAMAPAGDSYDVAPPGRAAWVALSAVAALVALWLVAPMLVVIPTSFTGLETFQFPPPRWSTHWYGSFVHDPAWMHALLTSLEIAVIVTGIATALGTAAALALAKARPVARIPVNTFLVIPLIVPSVVVAIGIYAVFLKWHLVGSVQGFVLAHTCLAIPFVVVTVGSSLQSFDPRLEDAAASLGSHPFRTFMTVTARLIAPGIAAGALFAFIASFDELVIALFLVDPGTRTLPVQMFTTVVTEPNPTVAVAATLIFCSTVVVFTAAFAFARRRGQYV